MLFIPFFRKVDWSNPPLITILLILANCLIFIVFQSRDDEYTEQAYEFYLQSQLPDIEIPLYLDYLKNHNQDKKAEYYQTILDSMEDESDAIGQEDEEDNDTPINQDPRLAITVPMQQDYRFTKLLTSGSVFAKPEQFNTWKDLHQQFENHMQKAVWYSYGLKPTEPTILTYFTNMFLHGGWGHLIGNMVFLFIIGFVVEYAMGKTAFFTSYIIAGLTGGLLYVLLNSSTHTATVGASGAIAGLMGMYTVLFGARKINFFYFILVYFDYIKAPAIILFPIWLGQQVVQLMMETEQGVNYYAHIGGLCSGALAAFVAKKFLRTTNDEYLDQNDKEDAQKANLEKGMELLAQLKFAEAAKVFSALVAEHPQNRDYLIQWYNAAKRQPASEDFHTSANRILTLADKSQVTYKLIQTTYNEYMKLAQPQPRLNAALLINVITAMALGGFFEDAEKGLILLKRAKNKEQVAEAALVLANAYHKANNSGKYRQCLELIAKEFAQTPSATEASRRLEWLGKTA
jgi:membrane associated rhomboid family serine protease